MAKITKKQLETIVEFQTEINTILNNIGTLEAQKHSLLHKIAGVNEKIENNKNKLHILSYFVLTACTTILGAGDEWKQN